MIVAANAAAEAARASAAVTTQLAEDRTSLEIALMQAQGDAAGALAAQRALDIAGMTAAQIAAYDYNAALREQIEAANAATEAARASAATTQRLAEDRASLEIDLMQAQGDAAGALAAQRALDIAGMDAAQIAAYDYNAALQAQIVAANAAAAAAAASQELIETNWSWQQRIDVLTGASTQREIEQANALASATDDTTRALINEYYAQLDLASATNAATAATVFVIGQLGRALDEHQILWAQQDAAQKLIDDARAAAANAAAEAARAAAATTQQLANDRASLEIELMRAQGNAAGALAAQRALDIAGMDAAQIAAYDYNAALRDQIVAANAAAEAARASAATTQQLAGDRASLEIDLMRAQGNAAGALAAQRALDITGMDAAQIAAYDYNAAIREQIDVANAAAEASRAAAAAQKQLNEWLNANALDANLSPLTAKERFAESQSQYVENLLKAQGGDQAAIAAFSGYADRYSKESLAMYGRASTDYVAIYRAIRDQAGGLIGQGIGAPGAPGGLGLQTAGATVQEILQGGQRTAKEQTDDLLKEIRKLNDKVDALAKERRESTVKSTENTAVLKEAVEKNSRDTVTGIAGLPNRIGRLT